MAFAIADRVQEVSSTTGTGTFLLTGAVTGYQSFAVIGNTNTTYYTIADQSGTNWEVGIGTYYSSNVSLARTTILSSSNANAVVNFGAGTKSVFVTYPAERAIYADSSNITTVTNLVSGNVSITGGTLTGVNVTATTFSSANVNITGGTINSTTQNASTYTNVTVNGGTINGVSLSNITYGGLGTMSTQNANAVAITGGTVNSVAHTGGSINNMTIGATTANTGAFTTITTTSPINVAYGGTGLANLTAGYLVTGNNVSQAVLIAPGTSGNVLVSNGTAWSSNASSTNMAGAIANASVVLNSTNATSNGTIGAGYNGFSVGPVTVANGISITVSANQRWLVL